MFIVGLFSWWYGAGWKAQIKRVEQRLASVVDYFSIGLLIKTLFAPFRQISAGQVSGSIGVQWQAFVDKLVSRSIGAIVRSFMIIFGLITLAVTCIVGVVTIIFWALIPLLPLAGLVLMMIGWVPSWL